MQHPPHGDEHELFQLRNRKLLNLIRNRFRLSEDDARDVAQFAWLIRRKATGQDERLRVALHHRQARGLRARTPWQA